MVLLRKYGKEITQMIENDWNLLRDCSDFTQPSANPSYIKFYLKKIPFESVLMVLLRKYVKEITKMIVNGWNLLRDCSDFIKTSANRSKIKFYLRKIPFESVLMVLLRKYDKEIAQMIENDWNLLRDCSDFTQTSSNTSYIEFYLKKKIFESVLMALLRKYGKEITQMIENDWNLLRDCSDFTQTILNFLILYWILP
jgi:ribosome-associated toxin RatA of RatAB toxin-antitoxin module